MQKQIPAMVMDVRMKDGKGYADLEIFPFAETGIVFRNAPFDITSLPAKGSIVNIGMDVSVNGENAAGLFNGEMVAFPAVFLDRCLVRHAFTDRRDLENLLFPAKILVCGRSRAGEARVEIFDNGCRIPDDWKPGNGIVRARVEQVLTFDELSKRADERFLASSGTPGEEATGFFDFWSELFMAAIEKIPSLRRGWLAWAATNPPGGSTRLVMPRFLAAWRWLFKNDRTKDDLADLRFIHAIEIEEHPFLGVVIVREILGCLGCGPDTAREMAGFSGPERIVNSTIIPMEKFNEERFGTACTFFFASVIVKDG